MAIQERLSAALHERIARTLGWSVRETQGLSLLMLRELVRDKDPTLAREITRGVQTGEYILEPAPPPQLWHAIEIFPSTPKRPVRHVVVGSFRAGSREEAEDVTARRWPRRGLETRTAREVKEWQERGLGAVEIYDPHRRITPEKAAKPKPTGPRPKRKSETYQAAKERLLNQLRALGWQTRPDLKFPWAKHPDHDFRVNFKTQAVYLNDHSLWIDIRGMTIEEFMQHVAHAANVRGF